MNSTEKTEENLQNTFEKNEKIIDCLNELEEIVIKQNLRPIKIKKKKKDKIFNRIQEQIKYISRRIDKVKIFETISLKVFELLFLEDNKFNYTNFEEKILIFKIVLIILKGESFSEKFNATNLLNSIISKIKNWNKLLSVLEKKYKRISFIVSAYLYYSKDFKQVIEMLICILECIHNKKIELTFEINNIDNFKENEIIDDFTEILKDGNNCFTLDYINGHFKKTNLFLDEICNLCSLTEQSKKKNKIIQINPKKMIIENTNTLISKLEDQTQIDSNSEKNLDKNLDNEIQSSDKSTETTHANQIETEILLEETQKKENIKKQNVIIEKIEEGKIEELDKINDMINKMNQLIKKQNENIEKQNKKIDELSKENRELINFNKQISKENKELINFNKQILEKNDRLAKENKEVIENNKQQKQKIKNLENEIKVIKEELSSVKKDLNLIKHRDGLKTFIDYFYYRISQDDITYTERLNSLEKEIKNSNKDLKDDYEDLLILLKTALDKYFYGNFLAHDIKKDNFLLKNIFQIIDPDNKYDNIQKGLNKLNANEEMMKLLEWQVNFSSKDKVENILSKMTFKELMLSIKKDN